MKAFLLAAGKGTRLRPLTDHMPKCLVPIAGMPLLQLWFEMLRDSGVTEVLVNTHHLAGQVRQFVASHPVEGLDVTLFHEEQLLGSAGTVAANRAFVAGEKAFLVIYADNLTDLDLHELVAFHRQRNAEFTMALFRTPAPSECGIAVCDANDRVVEFQEKPEQPGSDWANAGLYVAGPSLFDVIPAGKPVTDFGFDVLPALVGRMYGYHFDGLYCDTGTPARLDFARKAWEKKQEHDDNTRRFNFSDSAR
jgi:mannose-1-phosphate guanylyltransferase